MSDNDHPSLSLREAMRRLADPAKWAEYEALCAAGWTGYPPPHPDLGPRFDTPETAADFLRAMKLRQRFEDEVVAALRRGHWRLVGRAYAGGPIVSIEGSALYRSDDSDTPAGGYVIDFPRERVLQHATVRYSDLAVVPSPLPDPEEDRGARAERAEAPVYRTGLPGRPQMSWNLIETECRHRWDAGERHTRRDRESAAGWARVLLAWLQSIFPSAPRPTLKTLGNRLSPLLRELKANSPK